LRITHNDTGTDRYAARACNTAGPGGRQRYQR
jgi:hypothetical protein